jgi:hypothetical protein
MTEENLERMLNELPPRGVRKELRCRVLEAVDGELLAKKEKPSRGMRWAALATAASLLLGIGLNVWASRESERRFARLFGPPPVSKQAMELAADVEKITDAKTGQWVYCQLTRARPSGEGLAKYYAAVEALIREQQIVSKENNHETGEKNPEMDRDRTGSDFGDRAYLECMVRLDYRCTA